MKLSKILLFSIVIVGLTTSCEKAYVLPEPVKPIDPSQPVVLTSFATEIQPIFTSNSCTGCHDGSQAPDLTAGNSYAALVSAFVTAGAPSSSILYTTLAGPGGKMYDMGQVVSASELAAIKKWIEEGALNN